MLQRMGCCVEPVIKLHELVNIIWDTQCACKYSAREMVDMYNNSEEPVHDEGNY